MHNINAEFAGWQRVIIKCLKVVKS